MYTYLVILYCTISSGFGKSITNQVVLEYQDSIGQYSFGYSAPESARSEIRSADGITRGAFSYVDDAGVIQTAKYTADSVNGFRIEASNLPESPSPIEDTPEVKAARLDHLRAHEAALKITEVQKSHDKAFVNEKINYNIVAPKIRLSDEKKMNDEMIVKKMFISQLNNTKFYQDPHQMKLQQKSEFNEEIPMVTTSLVIPNSNVNIQNRIELRAMDLSTFRAPLQSMSQDKAMDIPVKTMVQSEMQKIPLTVILRSVQRHPTDYLHFVPSYYY